MNQPLNNPKKILFINIFGIGDVLFTTPLAANIKRLFPQAEIGYVCNNRSFPVLENNPHIHKTFIYERDEFYAVYKLSPFAYARKVTHFWGEIKKERYDCVFDFSLNSFMSFSSFLIGIPRRIGFNYKNRSPWLSDAVVLDGYEDRHVVEYYLDLLKTIAASPKERQLQISLMQADNDFANEFFKKNGIKDKINLVGIVPGGGASWGKEAQFKRWESGQYANLADKIVEKSGSQIILFGDKSEQGLCQSVVEKMKNKPVNACGQTSVRQMAALAKRAGLMVVNDGGPLHIAVAAGVKTLSIFGPVDPKVYGPYPADGHRVVVKGLACQPCYRKFRKSDCGHLSCLKELTVGDVFAQAEKMLK